MIDRDWQPIETGPRDGTVVLCWPRDTEHATARWDFDRWAILCCGQGHYDITHWMPLPEGPKP